MGGFRRRRGDDDVGIQRLARLEQDAIGSETIDVVGFHRGLALAQHLEQVVDHVAERLVLVIEPGHRSSLPLRHEPSRTVPTGAPAQYLDHVLDRVEAIGGSNSLLFGSGDAGGVITSASKRAYLNRRPTRLLDLTHYCFQLNRTRWVCYPKGEAAR